MPKYKITRTTKQNFAIGDESYIGPDAAARALFDRYGR